MKVIRRLLLAAALALGTLVPGRVDAQIGHEMLTNNSGGQITAGTVLVVDTSAQSFTTTTTASEKTVVGVAAETIENGAAGLIYSVGSYTTTIQVTGTVAVGDFLRTSTTAGRAASNGSDGHSCFAIATTANASGLGTVEGVLLVPRGDLSPSTAETISSSWTFTLGLAAGNSSEKNVTIGGTARSSLIRTHSDSSLLSDVVISHYNASVAGTLDFTRSLGTQASPSAVTASTGLGSIRFLGFDGTDYATAARIASNVTSDTPGAGDMPGNLVFQVTPDGSETLATALTIDDDKTATFHGSVIGGVSGTTRGQIRTARGTSTDQPGVIDYETRTSPNRYYTWITDAGQLRVHSSLPTSDTDGSAIGPLAAAEFDVTGASEGDILAVVGGEAAWATLVGLDAQDGSAGAPPFGFSSSAGNGMFLAAANTPALSSNSVERVRYPTTGVVFNTGKANYDFTIKDSALDDAIVMDADGGLGGGGILWLKIPLRMDGGNTLGSNNPSWTIFDEDAGSNEKIWNVIAGAGTYTFRVLNDALGGAVSIWTVNRTGTTVNNFTVVAPLVASAAVTLSPANANVVLSPSGSGVVTIGPAAAGTMNNVAIGGTTPLAGAFTTLAASAKIAAALGMNYGPGTELTIAGGAIAPTGPGYYRIDTEGDGATDDLDNITSYGGVTDGDVIVLRQENSARDITVRSSGGGSGNLRVNNGGNRVGTSFLSVITLIRASGVWVEHSVNAYWV